MGMGESKKRVFSGIQPSGGFTLGNYVGAIRYWAPLQDEYDCLYSVVNLHSLTVKQDPDELRRRTFEGAAMLLASGIDAEKGIIFVQSQVSQHTELAWILDCFSMYGEMTRMTQFKDKSTKQPENINMGLLNYPVLMAADILLYDAHYVPVGEDQKQHVEIARDIAQRFNHNFPGSFVVPEPRIQKQGARIMSLQEPTAKMSKSDKNVNATIFLSDDADMIVRKFKKATTDSDGEVRRSPDKQGVSNLMTIYAAMTGKTDEEIEREFEGQGYGTFKQAVAQSVVEGIAPLQKRYKEYLEDVPLLTALLQRGAARARELAEKKMASVYDKLGLL